MIGYLIGSFLVAANLFTAWTALSGGSLDLYSYSLYLFMFVAVVPFFVMKGNRTAVLLLVSRKKRFESYSVSEVKKLYEFTSFIIKIVFVFSLLFTSIASVVFLYNRGERTFLGPNLATLLQTPLFAFFFALVLLPLKVRAKLQCINLMKEEEPVAKNGNKASETAAASATETIGTMQSKTGTKTKIVTAFKILAVAAWVAFGVVFLCKVFTKGSHEPLFLFDIPSVLFLVLCVANFLVNSGSTTYVARAFAFVFTGKKIGIAEKAQFQEVFSSLIKTLLCLGGETFFIACMGMLCNLVDAASLPANYHVGSLCFLYSVFLSIILMLMYSLISNDE